MVRWLGPGAVTAGARVPFLVRELRPCKPRSTVKKKKRVDFVMQHGRLRCLLSHSHETAKSVGGTEPRTNIKVLQGMTSFYLTLPQVYQGGSGLVAKSCPTVRPHARLLCPRDSPSQNTGVGCHFRLQWVAIFPTQELNPGLLHCRQILYQLSYEGRPDSRVANSYSKGDLEWRVNQ